MKPKIDILKVTSRHIGYGLRVQLETLPEDSPIRGNALVSGDKTADKEYEDLIINRLMFGDEYAWFCAHVKVEFGPFVGHAYLGECSYADKDDFMSCPYYQQLIDDAIDDLNMQIASGFKAIRALLPEKLFDEPTIDTI